MQGHAQGYKWVGRGMHACRGMHMGMKEHAGVCTGVCSRSAEQESVCKAANAGGGVCFPPQSRESLRWEEEEPLRLHTAKILNQFKLRY